MRICIPAIAMLAAALAGGPLRAADVCHERDHQFGKMRHCVTSVRPPQGGTNYGPENLAATGDESWCAAEGARGTQTVTLYETPSQIVRTLSIASGFEPSDNPARQGRRIKRAMIETDRGSRATVTLKDSAKSQNIVIAKARIRWIRLTVLETYPATGYSAVCVSEFLANLEEFAN